MTNAPKLRGHHLICLHFFSGKGYDQEFIENLKRTISASLESGLEITLGADNICEKCPNLKDEKCSYTSNADRIILKMDEFALKLLGENAGAKLEWDSVKEKIPSIFKSWMKKYCKKCSWASVCEEDDFYRKLKNSF
ncbi:MAG: DUF1284 domain-containing protein [Nitrospiraceae bacterium]|nr:DUF1284 domain-containing protein [Nitrospiraceae bacterium]